MEILHISHKYPPGTGGMEKQSFELVTGFSNMKDITCHHICYEGKESKVTWFIKSRSRVKKMLKEYPTIRLIHINDGLLAVLTPWIHDSGVATAVTLHGLDVTFPLSLYRRRLSKMLSKFDTVICVSSHTMLQAVNLGVTKRHLRLIHNGVDHNIANIPVSNRQIKRLRDKISLSGGNRKIILAVGRAVKRKGFSWFIKEVLPELSEDAVFVIAGPMRTSFLSHIISHFPAQFRNTIEVLFGLPSDVKAIEECMRTPALAARFVHLGKVRYRDLIALYEVAELFVMPNQNVIGDMEGFGLVALEASIRGTLPVVADIEGISDAIQNGKNGVALSSSDKDAWVTAINQLLSAEKLRAELAEDSYNYTVENYGWVKMCREYYDCFVSTVDLANEDCIIDKAKAETLVESM